MVADLEARKGQISVGTVKILKPMQSLFDLVRLRADEGWAELAELNEQEREEERQSLCAALLAVVREVADWLMPVLAGADSRLIPVELEDVVRQSVDKARHARERGPGKERVPVLYATPVYNYDIALTNHPMVTYRAVLELPDDTSGDDELPDFLLLSVPQVEKDAALLHAILLGHEIGHLWDWEQRITRRLVAAPASPSRQDAARSELVYKWIGELVADVLSCLLIGPAALFALEELASITTTHEVDLPTHPRAARRMKLMVEVLSEQNGFVDDQGNDVLQPFIDQSETAFEQPAVVDTPVSGEESVQDEWNAVLNLLPDIKRLCGEAIPNERRFGKDRWDASITASALLRSGLPCGEQPGASQRESVAVEPAVILNATWLAKMHGLGDLAQQLGSEVDIARGIEDLTLADEALDRIALKSLEISGQLSAT